jgi:hypothetical protein
VTVDESHAWDKEFSRRLIKKSIDMNMEDYVF